MGDITSSENEWNPMAAAVMTRGDDARAVSQVEAQVSRVSVAEDVVPTPMADQGEEMSNGNSSVLAYEEPVGLSCTKDTQISRCEDLVCKDGRCTSCETNEDCRVCSVLSSLE